MSMWRPLRLASRFLRTRERECILTALRMMSPSLMSFLTLKRELAMEISLASLGSSQILPLPHFFTEAARRFCNFSDMGGVRAAAPAWPLGGELEGWLSFSSQDGLSQN